MATGKASNITHPIRARVILTIMGRALTTQQIAALLPNIPRTSLYRHIRELADAGVLMVVGEAPIRGTVEKTYAVRPGATILAPEDVEQAGHEEYFQIVTGFLGGMTDAYQSYLAAREDGLAQDIMVRVFSLNLTTEEFQTLKRQMLELIKPLEANTLTIERRRRLIGLLGVPDQPNIPPTDE